jgi:hypothetical protein
MEQGVFGAVAATQPDVFVIGGDAFYTGKKHFRAGERRCEKNSDEAVEHASRRALESPEFQRMVKGLKAPVIGVYDDHDRGENGTLVCFVCFLGGDNR